MEIDYCLRSESMIEFKGKFDENVFKSVNKRSFKTTSIVLLVLCAILLVLGIVGVVWGEDAVDHNLGLELIAWF